MELLAYINSFNNKNKNNNIYKLEFYYKLVDGYLNNNSNI
jgi:hypothetical protein